MDLAKVTGNFWFYENLLLMIASKKWAQKLNKYFRVSLFLSVECSSENNSFSKEVQNFKIIQNQMERPRQVSKWVLAQSGDWLDNAMAKVLGRQSVTAQVWFLAIPCYFLVEKWNCAGCCLVFRVPLSVSFHQIFILNNYQHYKTVVNIDIFIEHLK
jgi:hypothetical protein